MKKFTIITSFLFSLYTLESINTVHASNSAFENVRDGFYSISLSSQQKERHESINTSPNVSLNVSPNTSPKSGRFADEPHGYIQYVKDGLYSLSLSNNERENFDSRSTVSRIAENMIFVPAITVCLGMNVLLNVFGGPATFWGVANAYSMIDDENIGAFRIASMAIGGVTLTCYGISNIINSAKYESYIKNYDEVSMLGRFTKSVDDPVSYFKMMSTNLVKKFTPKSEETV
ncbi:MAG: hypothetical protein ACRYGR_05185 [Janthinobacterium lividum]